MLKCLTNIMRFLQLFFQSITISGLLLNVKFCFFLKISLSFKKMKYFIYIFIYFKIKFRKVRNNIPILNFFLCYRNMGAFLDHPKTDKKIETYQHRKLRACSIEMQGIQAVLHRLAKKYVGCNSL